MNEEYNVTITENDNEWVRRWTTYYEFDGKKERVRHSERRQKYLCVLGPNAGERRTNIDSPDYAIFNRGSRTQRVQTSKGWKFNTLPNAILVWMQAVEQ